MYFIKSVRMYFFIFVAIAFFSSNLSFAKGVHVSGTKITIEPPSEFIAAERFPGFQHNKSGSSIMVTEIPAPVSAVGQGMTKEALASRGMELLEKTKVEVNNQQADLIKIKQTAGAAEYLKWMLLLGDSSTTLLITGTFTPETEAEVGNKIKNSLLTTGWDKEMALDYFDGLSFKMGETDELKYAKRISNMILLARDGEFGKPGAAKPMLIVGMAINPVLIEDLATFSNQRVLQTAKVEGIAILEEKKIEVDGHQAYEIIASATDSSEKISMRIYQVIIAINDSYFMAQGRAGESISKQYLDQFRQLVKSITFTAKD